MVQQHASEAVYACMYCGELCSLKFTVGQLTLPFCSFKHAGAWRRTERGDRGRITIARRRR